MSDFFDEMQGREADPYHGEPVEEDREPMEAEPEPRRLRRLSVHMDLVNHWLHGTPATVCDDMPADAKMVRWYGDHERNCVTFIVESETFAETWPGDVLPEWCPIWRVGP